MTYPEPQPLRMVLRDRRMTQTELARAIGVAQPLVSYYVRGARRPSLRFMQAVSEYLNLPIERCFRVEYVPRAIGDFPT
jgi:transcriptional regulator with XRE-family HTH domain